MTYVCETFRDPYFFRMHVHVKRDKINFNKIIRRRENYFLPALHLISHVNLD